MATGVRTSSSKRHKLKDLHKIAKEKQKLQDILKSNDNPPEEQLSKLTKRISKLLNAALEAKEDAEGTVAIDRKLKLVVWACNIALDYMNKTYYSTGATGVRSNIAQSSINRVCGDICRYMSVVKSVTRSDRPLSDEEKFVRDYWTTKAIVFYDKSDLSLAGYDVRIRHLFGTSPHRLMLATIFNLRKLIDSVIYDQERRLPPIENRTLFVEEMSLKIRELVKDDKLPNGFSLCTLESINYVKHVESGINISDTSLEKRLRQVSTRWNHPNIETDPQEADATLIGLTLLALLLKRAANRPPPFLLSVLIKSPPLKERLQVMINPDKPKQWTSQTLEYLFENTIMENEALIKKIQKLNSRPAYF